MANLLTLEAFLFIQMGTPNSPPKLKELGCLELKITTTLLDLLGYPLESSLWAYVLRASGGEFKERVINEGETSPTIPLPCFLEFGFHLLMISLSLSKIVPKNLQ